MADEKITALRLWMQAQGIDAYLVPHADRFQSEYLQAGDERLAWLTGFTGSAGLAIVTAEKAALFTDGRYMLQAAQQIDPAVYEIVEAPPATPTAWLETKLDEKAVIGFDPWLITVAQMAHWQREAKQWDFAPLEQNPIDTQWQNKPRQDMSVAEQHELKFAGQSTPEKVAAVISCLHKHATALLITEPGLVCWLLNMRGRDVAHTPLVHALALLDRDGHVTLFVDPDKITLALRDVWGQQVTVEKLEALYDMLQKTKAPLQIDPRQCPFAIKEFCVANTIQLIEATDPAVNLRAAKNDVEIAGAAAAHQQDLIAFADFMAWFKAQDFSTAKITELDVVARLTAARKKAGALDNSFDTIAGFGGNGAIVHYRADETSNATLAPDNLLLLDSGGQYRTGTTDVTRVLPIGTPSAQMKTHYTAVLKGLIELSTTRFPAGTTGIQLDAIARAPIWALGLDYAHGTGHGVGSYLSVHEGPQGLSVRAGAPFMPGMILSIEPGIYLEGQYGIRLENLVVVIEDNRPNDVKKMLAFKTLTKLPFEAGLIDWAQLNAMQIDWLQAFQTFPSKVLQA